MRTIKDELDAIVKRLEKLEGNKKKEGMHKLFKVGDVIGGYCGGYFGSDFFDEVTCIIVNRRYALFERSDETAFVINDTDCKGLTRDMIKDWMLVWKEHCSEIDKELED